jgi:hypothetical protein
MKRDYWASSRMRPTIEQRGRFTIHRLIKWFSFTDSIWVYWQFVITNEWGFHSKR